MRVFLLVTFFSMLLQANGETIYKNKCSSCHKPYISMEKLKENFIKFNNTKLKLKAPTLNQLSHRLKIMIGDGFEDKDVHEFEVKEFIKDYAYNPTEDKKLCHKKVLEAFKTMHSMKGKITEAELSEVSKYIYDYEELVRKKHASKDEWFEVFVTKAKKEKKYILVEAEADDCYYCKKMKKETLSTKEVKEYLEKNFIVVPINVSKKELPAGLSYSFTPTFFFLDSDKKVINTVPGFWDKKEFLEILQSVKKGDKK